MNRPLVQGDNVGIPCSCSECVEAGVEHEPQRRIPGPMGPRWIHGNELANWIKARADFMVLARKAAGRPGRRGDGLIKLVEEE